MSEEATQVASRGHNLVLVSPPSPGWAVPMLAGLLGRLATETAGPCLALCPAEAMDEWARVAEPLARPLGLTVAAGHGPARLTRLLRSDAVALIFTSPETAHELVRRAALKMDGVSGVVLLWPEAWRSDDPLSALLQDVSKETQRIIVTADLAAAGALVERYCWRAPVVDLLGADWTGSPPAVRSTPVAWRRRLDVLGDLVEQLDPESLAVWTADSGDGDAIAAALAVHGATATVTTGLPPASSLIIAYDLPVPQRLRELAALGEVLLLVPPGTEAFAARLAPNRRPVHPSGALDRARADLDDARRTIAELLAQGPSPASLLALAPLFERYEATTVGAALYELWGAARRPPDAAPVAVRPAVPSVKLWVGIGKKDEVTAHDLVGLLVKDLKVARQAVGKVEIRETFSLLELTGVPDPDQVAEQMTGKTIRKRRLAARVDRGKERSRR